MLGRLLQVTSGVKQPKQPARSHHLHRAQWQVVMAAVRLRATRRWDGVVRQARHPEHLTCHVRKPLYRRSQQCRSQSRQHLQASPCLPPPQRASVFGGRAGVRKAPAAS